MARDIVANILSLRKSINQARLQKQKEPIFSAVIENEQIAFELPQLSCQSENDFRRLVEMLYKLIIESSGEGKRFPTDSRIEGNLSAIRELRNHFLHAREHGKEKDVKNKYRKVGEIYFRISGKRVPLDQDWGNARIGLLKLVEDCLERAFEVVAQEATDYTIPVYVDNKIEVFNKGKFSAFQSRKRKSLSALSNIPVFIPDFTIHAPLPNIGINSTVFATSRPPLKASISKFCNFLKDIESKWIAAPYLLSTYGPLNWSMSDDGHFAFGCGAENLSKELIKHRRVAIGGIMQGCYGEDYSKTCFLVINGYRKGEIIRDICADLYLSCIPADWKDFNSLFKAFRNLEETDIAIDRFSLEPLTVYSWESEQNERIKLEILGGLGREGFGQKKADRETDTYSGVIVKGTSLANLKFKCTNGTTDDDKELKRLNPIYQLKELVVSITNTVPYCDEFKAGLVTDVFSPRISMVLFDAYGATIYAINIHCTSPLIGSNDDE